MVTSFYSDFVKALRLGKAKFMIIGGFAVNLHGVERQTGDFDIAVEMTPDNIDRFIAASRHFNMKPSWPGVKLEDFANSDNRVLWQTEKNAVAFPMSLDGHEYFEVDVLLKDFDFAAAYPDAMWIPLGDISLPVVSLNVLLSLKKEAGREKDIADIHHLKKVKEESEHAG
ncbi:MAG TPA: hypothetical protein VLH56_04680 [Dissulfurispiraceae bacterium]|nr:hypothetical protein [Dissulfurispiraceae bacterium]